MQLKLVSFLLIFGFLAGVALSAQEATPATEAGEDLDLYGVLELLLVAEDLEALEKALNDEKSEVNNLDLDENGEVDYIRIEEHIDGNAHVIVLQVPLGEEDYQDVATIEIEKLGEDDFTLQVVGNEELYGPDFIIEPNPEAESFAFQSGAWAGTEERDFYENMMQAGYAHGPFMGDYPAEPGLAPYRPAVVIVIGAMPVVRVIFRVGYRRFVSPYRWGVFPVLWSPWRVVARSIHRSRVRRFHQARWRTTRVRRSTRGRSMYQSRKRSSAKAVNKRKTATTKKATTSKKKTTPTKKKKNTPTSKSNTKKKTSTAKKKKKDSNYLWESIPSWQPHRDSISI